MLKFEWPLIVPDCDDVTWLSSAIFDIAEYLVSIAENEGLADGMAPLSAAVTVHIACHARAQNMGQKAAEMLRLLPETEVRVIERCSGHGGSWGIMKENFDVALLIDRPVARDAAKDSPGFVVSECPLARDHIVRGVKRLGEPVDGITPAQHPVFELMARAYGL